jgi:hypothetical protein
MPFTYDDAAALVYQTSLAAWDPEWGTFILDDRGIIEDELVWVFVGGAREDIVDQNPQFRSAGGGSAVVSKLDGTLEWQAWLQITDAHPALTERPNPHPIYFDRATSV